MSFEFANESSRDTDDLAALYLSHLQELIRPEQYRNWFSRVRVETPANGTIHVLAPNPFVRDWISRYFGDRLSLAARNSFGRGMEVIVRLDPDAPPSAQIEEPPEEMPADDSEVASTPAEGDTGFLDRQSDTILHPAYTFRNFVVGASNQFAHAAAKAVSDAPGESYNPFFLHGAVGLGKTHLLQAICHALFEQNPKRRILYVSCEAFINTFIEALENNELHLFRNKFRNLDVLLVDDIQILSNKERSQDEFFHTFNTLYNLRKQIVLSSDAPPSEVPQIQERLVSRFEMGLVAQIDPPDYETRVNIVRHKARLHGCELPEEVAQVIAERVATNIRELEGTVVRLVGFAKLTGEPIDVRLARRAIVRDGGYSAQPLTIQDIVDAVTAEYPVRLSDLQSKRRQRSVVVPRQIAIYLARKYTNLSFKEIAGFFGGRDHATAIHAESKVRGYIENDPAIRDAVLRIERRLQSRS